MSDGPGSRVCPDPRHFPDIPDYRFPHLIKKTCFCNDSKVMVKTVVQELLSEPALGRN